MQRLRPNKKKRWLYSGLGTLAAGAFSLWLWLSLASSPPASAAPSSAPVSPLPDAKNSSVSGPSTRGILPYGTSFKTELFSSPRYRELIFNLKLEVRPEELGRDNPFLKVEGPGVPKKN